MSDMIEHHEMERLHVPYFFTLSRDDQRRGLESLIFASDDPLTTKAMHRILVLEDPTQELPGQQELPLDGDPDLQTSEPREPFHVPAGYFDALIDEINDELVQSDRPFRIVRIAGGYQFATTPEHGQLVQRLLKARNRKRLSQAALETLAIIAYRQPMTKAEIEAIRGVNASEIVNALVEKQLIAMVGRSESIGKPLLYGTTDEFLRVFGLNDLSELPKLREIDDLLKTTTTLMDMDDELVVKTDHKTLRRQLSALLDASGQLPGLRSEQTDEAVSTEATSGAYWHHSMEHEAEDGLVEDPEPGVWEDDADTVQRAIDEISTDDQPNPENAGEDLEN
ncbi:MAG: SMC-Scp complex subunit ScpB [Candidatus Kapabacteria bacterium]|nr:SMC-Scp complex subunit ScpB [Candidatus Kapabacteria bacterium]